MLAPLAFGLTLSLAAPRWVEDPAIVDLAWQEAAVEQKLDPKHQADLEGDVKIGKKYSEEVEKEFKLSKDEAAQARVQKIGAALAAIARANQVTVTWGDRRLNPFEYQFKVVEDKDINAFSLPGGYIYVYEGLCKFADTDDELAGVLGHEISHAAFRHVATLQREMSRLQLVTLPLILIAIFAGGETGSNVGTLAGLIGTAKGSGWSVSAEEAADFGGFQYMRLSGYNPVAMLTFMERLAKEQRFTDRIDLGIYRTHPPSRDRADTLTKRLMDSGIPIRRSLASSAYRVRLKDVEGGAVEMWFDERRITVFGGPDAKGRSLEASERMNEFFDQVPDLFDIQLRGDDTILGKRQPLLRISPDDAAAAKKPVKDLTVQASNAIKRSLYLLAYRVWDAR